ISKTTSSSSSTTFASTTNGPLGLSTRSARFLRMQRLVLSPVVRPVINSFVRRQLDPIDKLHIGTLIDLFRVTGRKIRNEKPHRPARLNGQRLPLQPINHQRPVSNRRQRNAGVKIVARRVQPQIFCPFSRLNPPQNAAHAHGVSRPPWHEPAHVRYLISRIDRRQIGKRQQPRRGNFTSNRQHKILPIKSCLPNLSRKRDCLGALP